MKHYMFPLLLLLASCAAKTSTEKTTENTRTSADTPRKANHTEQIAESASRNIADFIPKGYSLLDSASGNLNLDAYTDLVLVLKKNNEEKTSDVIDHPERRPVLILTGNAEKSYTLAARNDNTVLCVNCGGMMGEPFEGIVIEKEATFSLLHYGGSAWRWSKNISYKYNKNQKNWFLDNIEESSYHTSDPEKTEVKTQTAKDFGKVKFADFDIYAENDE